MALPSWAIPAILLLIPSLMMLRQQGIIVTSMNTQLPLAQAKYSSNGFGYAGAILYNAGYALGQEAVKSQA